MRKFIYEDELPNMTKEEYNKWHETSWLMDGVRVGKIPQKMVRSGIIGFDNNQNTMHDLVHRKHSNTPGLDKSDDIADVLILAYKALSCIEYPYSIQIEARHKIKQLIKEIG